MKRIVLLAFLALISTRSDAQETYSLNASANQVTRLSVLVTYSNEQTCVKYALSASCTQAQVCTSAGAPGGASCSAAQARNANVRIFPLTQAGREEFMTFSVVVPNVQERFDLLAESFRSKYCTWFKAQNATVVNAECAKISAPDDCNICR